ncbi:hypothetical protein BC939DRAFT_447593 [Gamsiella multidivaricata]|uniref:uncharacterized protein n=1 Tax=Gamsiella multidivaricata TaxID=101098 RepID=UPI00221F69AB|nr:uncharacterized protein BC939DRAFT_447593 [Gamsiella multidivaricata]KAG0365201.1 hypothetical protein BGZ54_006765 [Gamsiella multidivaricata]KAI7826037.1 hypothetical protein BC939DRAFT_447593 [Gamsiella multidivaricata]
MKIITTSAVLCLAASTVLAGKKSTLDTVNRAAIQRRAAPDVGVTVMAQMRGRPLAAMRREKQASKPPHKEHSVEAHRDGENGNPNKDHSVGHKSERHKEANENNVEGAEYKNGQGQRENSDSSEKDVETKKDEKKMNGGQEKEENDARKTTGGVDTGVGENGDAGKKDNKQVVPDSTSSNSDPPRDTASPLWLVQPFGASVWEHDRDYAISWVPNPDPIFAKTLKPMTPVDIRLMQGPPEDLHEIAVLETAVDFDLNSFQWTIPATVVPAKDYTIRLTHEGDLDTYSHYFEIVAAGDPRSSKSNVDEPLQMPQEGDAPEPATKESTINPAAPPNPLPTDSKSVMVTKSTKNISAAVGNGSGQSASVMAMALALFGAVYML